MEKLQEIITAGQKLAEKKTWLTKGFSELMQKINLELGKIPTMDEAEIWYQFKEYTVEIDGDTYKRRIRAVLGFDGDAFLKIVLSSEDSYEWKQKDITSPVTTIIRAFSEKLPEMFDFFITEIQKRNIENQAAEDVISAMLGKLK